MPRAASRPLPRRSCRTLDDTNNMVSTFYFISHPNVQVRPDIPVPEWPLSALGHSRMQACLRLPWIASVTAIFSSAERKAMDSARHLADHLSLPIRQVVELGENNRSSTGYLPSGEFELVANAFFASPNHSVRGWERAADAQARVVSAAIKIAEASRGSAAVAVVSHGAVGTLLYCYLTRQVISRRHDQPLNGGGNYFSYSMSPPNAHGPWAPVDGRVI